MHHKWPGQMGRIIKKDRSGTAHQHSMVERAPRDRASAYRPATVQPCHQAAARDASSVAAAAAWQDCRSSSYRAICAALLVRADGTGGCAILAIARISNRRPGRTTCVPLLGRVRQVRLLCAKLKAYQLGFYHCRSAQHFADLQVSLRAPVRHAITCSTQGQLAGGDRRGLPWPPRMQDTAGSHPVGRQCVADQLAPGTSGIKRRAPGAERCRQCLQSLGTSACRRCSLIRRAPRAASAHPAASPAGTFWRQTSCL